MNQDYTIRFRQLDEFDSIVNWHHESEFQCTCTAEKAISIAKEQCKALMRFLLARGVSELVSRYGFWWKVTDSNGNQIDGGKIFIRSKK